MRPLSSRNNAGEPRRYQTEAWIRACYLELRDDGAAWPVHGQNGAGEHDPGHVGFHHDFVMLFKAADRARKCAGTAQHERRVLTVERYGLLLIHRFERRHAVVPKGEFAGIGQRTETLQLAISSDDHHVDIRGVGVSRIVDVADKDQFAVGRDRSSVVVESLHSNHGSAARQRPTPRRCPLRAY